MSAASPTPPPTPPPGITIPSTPGPDSKMKFTALLYLMFSAMAQLYTVLVQEGLASTNSALQFYAKQQDVIANKLAAINQLASHSQHPGHYQAEITLLRNMQEQIQTDIQQTQSTQQAMSSSAASNSSMLMSINQSIYQAMSGIVSGMS